MGRKRSLGFGFRIFGIGKKVSVSVSENLVSEKSLGFGFEKFGIGKKVSVSVSKNLVSEKKSRFRFWKIWYRKKSLGIGFGKFGIGKKVSVSVSVNILVSSFSGASPPCTIGFCAPVWLLASQERTRLGVEKT